MANENSTDPLRYKTVKDLGRIVALFEKYRGEERSLTDICRSLQMLPSKVSRLLRTLEPEGFFERNPDTGKHRIGPRFLQLGLLYVFNLPLRRIILPHLEHVVQDLSLSTGWGIFKNDQIIVVDRIHFGKRSVANRMGLNLPLHSSSYGKLFLAYLTAQDQERLLNSITFIKFTDTTISEPEKLREEIKLIKQRGYALDQGETASGSVGIAAPILNSDGDVIAAISVSEEPTRFTPDVLQRSIEYLTERARFISRQIGYDAPPDQRVSQSRHHSLLA
jgi:IclR family transcriptional regulator, KDG regulon repressor